MPLLFPLPQANRWVRPLALKPAHPLPHPLPPLPPHLEGAKRRLRWYPLFLLRLHLPLLILSPSPIQQQADLRVDSGHPALIPSSILLPLPSLARTPPLSLSPELALSQLGEHAKMCRRASSSVRRQSSLLPLILRASADGSSLTLRHNRSVRHHASLPGEARVGSSHTSARTTSLCRKGAKHSMGHAQVFFPVSL